MTALRATALLLLGVAGGCRPTSLLELPFGRGGRTGVTAPAEVGTGDVHGSVIDSASGQPVVGALVFATTDTSPLAPPSNFSTVTDASGHFSLLDVPAGKRVVEVRAIGFTRERQVVVVARGLQYTANLELRTGQALYQQQLEDLRVPTRVTPCRPSDVSTSWVLGALVESLSPHAQQDSAVHRDGRIPTPPPEKVRLVLNGETCRKAIAAWFEQGGIPNPYTQVYLFDLGGDGYALFDPAQALGNAQARVPVLGRDFRLLTILSF
ncbi:MAG: carboxypeptidase-like regulatory domain-containing protein [Gemmatimonadetes bacterium]|nr:carboxypeptidase-like regulatory domain-containing protein [Gemmatimonadota bacterium]